MGRQIKNLELPIKNRFTRVLKWPMRAKKGPIYTQTRQINYYFNRILRNVRVPQYEMSIIR
jgi:hypothetical protein